MKSLKKILAAGTLIAAAFGFFGCSDTEDDEDCTVAITVTDTSSTVKTVTIAIDSVGDYSGKDTHIIYTTDGSDPDVTYDATATSTYYADYGTADVYSAAITFTEATTIKARAFYIENATCQRGPIATKEITFTTSEDTSTATGTANGSFDFIMASSGNSNTTHYFDTSSTNVFALDSTNTHVYYQTQFSWKGSGKGNWYLYMRDKNNGLIKDSSNNTTFVAKGTYTGSCFDSTSVTPSAGTLTLTTSDNSYEGTAAVALNSDSKYQFTLKVNNSTSAATGVTVGDAK